MARKTKFQDRAKGPSDEFTDVFVHSGSCCQTQCDFCGRTHFVVGPEAGDYSEGELKALRDAERLNPDEYISGYDTISVIYLGGCRFVVGCPCNAAGDYELFIWRHRIDIMHYLGRRFADCLKGATQESDAFGQVERLMRELNDRENPGGRLIDLELET